MEELKNCLFHADHKMKQVNKFNNLPLDYNPMDICKLSFYYCSKCGYVSQESEIIDNKKSLYFSTILKQEDRNGLIPDFKQLSFFKNLFPYIEKDDNILEIGSNSGYNMSFFKNNGFENIESVELNPFNAKSAKEKGFEVYNMNYLDFIIKKDYKLILLSHVLEHISEPKIFLNKIYNDMNNDAILYIEVPDMAAHYMDKTIYEFYEDHMIYADQDIWKRILESMGFNIVNIIDRSDYHSVGFILKKADNLDIKLSEINVETSILDYLELQAFYSKIVSSYFNNLNDNKLAFYPLNIQPTIMMIYQNQNILNNIKFFIDDKLCNTEQYMTKDVFSLENAPISDDIIIIISTQKKDLQEKLFSKAQKLYPNNKIVKLLDLVHGETE